MAVTDTEIHDWKDDFGVSPGDTNLPRDSDKILTELDDVVRNVKTVVRGESERKPWIPAKIVVADVPGEGSLLFEGDVTQLLAPGRWLRVQSPTVTPDVYVQVRSTLYTGAATICVINYGYTFQGLFPTDSPTWTRVSDSSMTATGDLTATFVAGKKVIMWSTSTFRPRVKVIASSEFASGTTTVTFNDDDVPTPTTFYMMLESSIAPADDSDHVLIGTLDANIQRSSMVHFSQAGQVEIDEETTVTLPFPEADDEYTVLLTVVDRPDTGSDYESLIFAQNKTANSFEVVFNVDPSSTDEDDGASGGLVKIDWVLLRYILPAANCDLTGN